MQEKVTHFFHDNIFSIPSYQRDYAWKESNVEDLVEDLLEAERKGNDEMGHFLGTFVLTKNPDNPKIYDIVDGQQRATTLFMLKYVLNSKSKDPNRNLNYLLDDNDEYRLRLAPNNQEFFKKLLDQANQNQLNLALENEAKTEGQKKLYKAFKKIWDYMNNKDTESATKLMRTLDNMVVMRIEEKDSGRAIRIFQSINDRGQPLLILDKLKALLILYSNENCRGKLDNDINERFGEIFRIIALMEQEKVYSSLNIEAETDIFTYHARGYKPQDLANYTDGAKYCFTKLKQILKDLSKKEDKEALQEFLDHYSNDLLGFFRGFLKIMQLTQESVEAFKLLYILKIKPYFYPSLVRLQMNNIVDDEILRIFAQAHILLFALGSENYAKAHQLKNATESKDAFKKKVIESCQTCKAGSYKSIAQALEHITEDNDDWQAFHYLFLTYRCQKEGLAFYSTLISSNREAEHIIPQSVGTNNLFQEYGFNNKNEFDGLKDSFGNLLVLEQELNRKASDHSLAMKQNVYKDSKIPYNREFASSESFLSFNKEAIIKENEKFRKWAKESFFKDYLA